MTFELPRRYPLLFPAFGLGLGIYGAASFGALPTLALGIAAILAGFLVWRGRRRRVLAGWILAFLLGSWRAAEIFPALASPQLRNWATEKRTVRSVFRVRDYPRCSARFCGGTAELLAWIDGGTERPWPKTGLSLRVWDAQSQWIPGEIYVADLKYSSPRRFRNPHGFDYPEYLRRQGIAATVSTSSLGPAERRETASPWQGMAADFRNRRLAWLRSVLRPGSSRAILEAFLFGEDGGLADSVAEVFRRSGLTHVLVVSGLHFVFLSFCFHWPLSWILSASARLADGGWARVLASFLAGIPTLFYAWMVGLSPSVLRSLASSALVLFALLGGWRKNFLSSLLLILFVFLLLRPEWLFSVSFQLSFASVAALALLVEAWRQEEAPRREVSLVKKAARGLTMAFFSSLGMNLLLSPWLAGDFHEFSLVSPLANLIFVPFFSVALPLGLVILFLGSFKLELADLLLRSLNRGIEGLFWGLKKMSDWSGASFLIAPWTCFECLAYLCLLLALLKPRPWRRSLICVLLALGLFAGGEINRFRKIPVGELRLTAFDVGQGESLLLELPEGQGLLLDGGGFPGSDFDVGRNVLMPELLARGRRRLDALILSHPDADHAKGLRYLLDRLPPREFWISPTTAVHPAFRGLKELSARRGVALRLLSQGEHWSYGGADFEVLWPPAKLEGASSNDSSLVLRVCHVDYCLLLTGDMEARVEAELQGLARRTTVLKVAHHGSKTSTSAEFLEAWKPKLALISAGDGNRYGLPHRQVLDELEKRGIEVRRTDREGQVEIEEIRESGWSRFPSCWFAIRAAVSGSRS